jgi:hypothetical protein
MKARVAFTVLALAAASASADDGSKAPAKPAEPAKPAPAAPAPAPKKERKTSPEAEAAVKRYASLLSFPNSKYKTVEMNSHCDVQMMGGEVGCKFTVKDGGVVTLDITLPEAVRQQYGDGQLSTFKNAAKGIVGGMFKPFIVTADAMAKQYDLASRVENGKTVIEMTKFADDAAWDKSTLWLNADGLVEKQKGMPNVDPNDVSAMRTAGDEIETTFVYAKHGDLYTIESAKVSQALGESTIKLTYYEVAGQLPLPKEVAISSPVIGELSIALTDFVLDGKPVAETARKPDEKPAAKPDAVKPAEPPKPVK